MNAPIQQQIRLPDVVDLRLPAQAVAVIMQALGEHGPHKLVHPVLSVLERQLLRQQIAVTPEPQEGHLNITSGPDKLISSDQ